MPKTRKKSFIVNRAITQKRSRRLTRVMVFGVFDGLHTGHRFFLRSAKKHGGELIAVVARDAVVRLLKNKTPRHDEKARARAIREMGLADRVVLGDTEQGTYGVIARWKPDIICLGYDQSALKRDLKERGETCEG